MPPIESVAVEEKKDVVGFIYPPPEVRNIVDKTANFVARNGPEFEARIRQNEQNNAKFNFLSAGDPYHTYYQRKVTEFRSGKSDADISQAAGGKVSAVSQQQHQKQQELLRAAVQESTIPKEPPPEYEFIADAPSISAFDLDVVRLTAQFVARNGRQFLTTLMNREQRNSQFDFLRPQHSLFQYFTRLLEQYTKVLIPPKDLMKRLEAESTNPQGVMKLVKQRVDWDRHQAALHQREEEELERERAEYAAIDWHDFSVVETIDYQPWEVGSFPPPTTPQEVGRRVLMQERIEEGVTPDNDMMIESDDETEQEQPSGGDRDDTQVQDMEEGSSEEESDDSDDELTKPKLLPKDAIQPVPVAPTPSQVTVKEYNPKQRQRVNKASEEYLVSPITGERLPDKKVDQHLKVNMLDPRWKEDRDRQLAEKSNQANVFASGDSVKSSLKQFSERRTDIFGAGDEETIIGKKIGEEEKKEEKATWDGHTSSIETTAKVVRANIPISEQIQQLHKQQGLVPDQEKEKIGPQPQNEKPKTVAQPPKPINPPMVPPGQIMNPMTITTPIQPMPPMMQGRGVMMVPSAPVMMAPRANFIPPSQVGYVQQNPMSMVDRDDETGEPSAKKARTEDSLVGEQEWCRRFPGPIKFKVSVPQVTDKPEWKLNGQILDMAIPLTETVSMLKSKIHDIIGLVPGKQKLARDGLFFKDALSLAYYNIGPGSIIQLQLKERGGRKK